MKFSRQPLYNGKTDNITGYCLKDDILESIIKNKGNNKLNKLDGKILIVFEMLPVYELFQNMIEKNENIALVINEYGRMEGIVTMEDVVETMLGLEIVDETDIHKDMQKPAKEV